MYRIYQLTRRGYPTIRTVVVPQAGGCTRNELEVECERIARQSASLHWEGCSKDWTVVALLGQYTDWWAANEVAKELYGVVPENVSR